MFPPSKLICFHRSKKKWSKLGRKNFPEDEAFVVHVHNDLCCRRSPPLLHSISCFYLHTLNREKRTFQKIKSSMCTMFTMTYAAVALNFSLAGSLYQLTLSDLCHILLIRLPYLCHAHVLLHMDFLYFEWLMWSMITDHVLLNKILVYIFAD